MKYEKKEKMRGSAQLISHLFRIISLEVEYGTLQTTTMNGFLCASLPDPFICAMSEKVSDKALGSHDDNKQQQLQLPLQLLRNNYRAQEHQQTSQRMTGCTMSDDGIASYPRIVIPYNDTKA